MKTLKIIYQNFALILRKPGWYEYQFSYLKHSDIDSCALKFQWYFQMNWPDIFKAKIRFPDKNELFACLTFIWSQLSAHVTQSSPHLNPKKIAQFRALYLSHVPISHKPRMRKRGGEREREREKEREREIDRERDIVKYQYCMLPSSKLSTKQGLCGINYCQGLLYSWSVTFLPDNVFSTHYLFQIKIT